MSAPSIIVIGGLNTDIVALGVKRFPGPGEHVYGRELKIGPGGKSRNIADMAAHIAGPDAVAMIGRTCKDKFGLWSVPIDSLRVAGVNTDYVQMQESVSGKMPGVALIPVDGQGNNQIFVLSGANDDFSPDDIDRAMPLLETAAVHNGLLVATLECPIPTVLHAVKSARRLGMRVIFDPGGIEPDTKLSEILSAGLYLIKPNEHETKVLTGIEVTDHLSAAKAARRLLTFGIEHVLITLGSRGAYLCSVDDVRHLAVPDVKMSGAVDETGCGDQSIAVLCALLQEGRTVHDASLLAIHAGTLQFHREGIVPVERQELIP